MAERRDSAPAPMGATHVTNPEYHRKQAAEFKRLGNLANTEEDRAGYARLAQAELLLIDPDPYLLGLTLPVFTGSENTLYLRLF